MDHTTNNHMSLFIFGHLETEAQHILCWLLTDEIILYCNYYFTFRVPVQNIIRDWIFKELE